MLSRSEAAQPLAGLKPQHAFFVGIDSDGCVFDTTDLKHRECFCPNIIGYWGLQAVSSYAREGVEFVNLHSRWRGINRWPALTRVLDILRSRPEVAARGVRVPGVPSIREFIDSGEALSNEGLKAFMAGKTDPELDRALEWSNAVDTSIARIVRGVPPFAGARECLELIPAQADVVVVSATPAEALNREWEENGLKGHVRAIAGQEAGSKKQHLALAAVGKYPSGHVLMIGDAPGDMDAARSNGALFYPINPGHEEESWERFRREGWVRFTSGRFAGDYEAALVAEFERLLPTGPPWQRQAESYEPSWRTH
jgi:phosphoglycolate phosphatase-like HAD superfamily hydrolase